MKLLLDMNLSPMWAALLSANGHEVLHWSDVGMRHAADSVILKWAAEHGYIVLTHDLDHGTILAASGDSAPSVIQFRMQDVSPIRTAAFVLSLLSRFEKELLAGALVTVDENRQRFRLLPIGR